MKIEFVSAKYTESITEYNLLAKYYHKFKPQSLYEMPS